MVGNDFMVCDRVTKVNASHVTFARSTSRYIDGGGGGLYRRYGKRYQGEVQEKWLLLWMIVWMIKQSSSEGGGMYNILLKGHYNYCCVTDEEV